MSAPATLIQIPNWKPRPYQLPLWSALERGKKRAIYTWHRRAGKDDIGLHWTAACACKTDLPWHRVGTYWYLLPQAAQARKAIWDAVDPHTGQKRIDMAFPVPLRKVTRNNEMFIELKGGSTWQVVGSDNFNSLVGSPPVGVVLSEYALSNPEAWSYLRPILRENGGWALFNFTPRGRNHAVATYEGALNDPDWFAEKLTAHQTPVFTPEDLEKERQEYIRDMGEDDGIARFNQEYMCDFNAPLIGSYYARQLAELEDAGHFGDFGYDKSVPVETASDIGRTDDFACIFYQRHPMRIHIIDYEAGSGHDVPWMAEMLQSRKYIYLAGEGKMPAHAIPWDAVPKTFASPRSVLNQLAGFGIRTRVVSDLKVQDGIQAARSLLPRIYFNTQNPKVKQLIESLRNYQRKYDEERKVFKAEPLHNWASHGADAFRYLAMAYVEDNPSSQPKHIFRPPTLEEVWEWNAQPTERRL